MPPSLGGGAPTPPRPNLGGPTQGQTNPGNVAKALIDVKNAAMLIQQALPNIPMGTPLHQDLINIVTKLSKHASEASNDPGLQQQGMLAAMRHAAANPMAAALQRMQGPPNAPPAMGGEPPAGPPG